MGAAPHGPQPGRPPPRRSQRLAILAVFRHVEQRRLLRHLRAASLRVTPPPNLQDEPNRQARPSVPSYLFCPPVFLPQTLQYWTHSHSRPLTRYYNCPGGEELELAGRGGGGPLRQARRDGPGGSPPPPRPKKQRPLLLEKAPLSESGDEGTSLRGRRGSLPRGRVEMGVSARRRRTPWRHQGKQRRGGAKSLREGKLRAPSWIRRGKTVVLYIISHDCLQGVDNMHRLSPHTTHRCDISGRNVLRVCEKWLRVNTEVKHQGVLLPAS